MYLILLKNSTSFITITERTQLASQLLKWQPLQLNVIDKAGQLRCMDYEGSKIFKTLHSFPLKLRKVDSSLMMNAKCKTF